LSDIGVHLLKDEIKNKIKIKIKIKSYLLVGHHMILAIHTQQKQQQQLDCLDWLPYLPTSDINLSSMYLLSPMIIIFFFFFRERVLAHGL
jgi:hypothetical protein